jgi:ring-1,2-phenylacetyl-CoA epoxidase subunit PaaD
MPATATDDALAARAWALLEHIPDPEIPVLSIRALGILRDIRSTSARGDGVEVMVTPTYSACPAISQIEDDIRTALAAHDIRATIRTQLAPAWSSDWISAEGRARLREYGIAPPQAQAVDSIHNVIRFAAKRSASAAVLTVPCPHCGATDTTETSHFGSTACKALYKCLACLEPFDYFKAY